MSIYEAFKDVLALAQKADNVELQRKIMALQGEAFELAEENRALKAQLTTRASLEFRTNAYWDKDTGDGPFCSKCWDADSRLVRVHKTPGYTPQCPNCRSYAYGSYQGDNGPASAVVAVRPSRRRTGR